MSSGEDCFYCILETLKEEFERVLLAVQENGAVDWSFAKNALRRLTVNDGIARVWLPEHELHLPCCSGRLASSHDGKKIFWKIFRFLMTSFENLNLKDTTLAADLMRHGYYFAQTYGMKFQLSIFDMFSIFENPYNRLRCLCDRSECRNFMLTEAQFRQLLKAPYNIPYPLIEEERVQIHKHVVWCTIREGQERLLYGFLKYGVMFLPAPNYFSEGIRGKEAITQLLLLRENYQRPAGRWIIKRNPKSKTYRRISLILRVMELLALELKARKKRPESDELPKRKRSRLSKYRDDISSCKSVYFRCLRRAFETIPEPFVSSNEVRELLRYTYDIMWNENLETCVSEIIADFEELHPEAAGPVIPRSLQHLSRCQVRENLRQSGNLPHGIKELGLTTLQEYIALNL